MRPTRFTFLLASALILAACAPTVRVNPAEVAQAFTLTVDGEAAPSSGSTFTYRSEDFDLDVVLEDEIFRIDLTNNTAETMRLVIDRSAAVLADGSSSGVVTGGTSYINRNDPQPTIVIPPAAKASEALFPRSLLGFESGRYGRGVYFDKMFEWPLTSRTVIRLILAVEIEGNQQEIALVFEGTPLPQSG